MATALVTGASSGLGAEFVRQLSASGWDVVVVSRDRARLEERATEARARGVVAEVLPADLSVRRDVDRVAARLRDAKRPIDLLVNNAGFGPGDTFVGSALAAHDAGLEVMVRAVMALSHAAAPAMVARGRGAILNVSSVAAVLGNGTYAAHKAWVDSFTFGLANELRGTGVTVTSVRPGLVRTEFHERAGLDYGRIPGLVWLRPAQVVRPALRATRRGRLAVTPSLRYKVLVGALFLVPGRARARLAGGRGGR